MTGSRSFTVPFSLDDASAIERAARERKLSPEEYVRSRIAGLARREAGLEMRQIERMYPWWRCNACGRVVYEVDDESLMVMGRAGPCCGKPTTYIVWPDSAAANLVAVALVGTEDGASLHASTLWRAFETLALPMVVAGHLDDRLRSRNDMIALYSALVGQSPKAALEAAGQVTWWNAWEELVAVRNVVGHRDHALVPVGPTKQREIVVTVDAGAINAFAALHNAAIEAAIVQSAKRLAAPGQP